MNKPESGFIYTLKTSKFGSLRTKVLKSYSDGSVVLKPVNFHNKIDYDFDSKSLNGRGFVVKPPFSNIIKVEKDPYYDPPDTSGWIDPISEQFLKSNLSADSFIKSLIENGGSKGKPDLLNFNVSVKDSIYSGKGKKIY